MSIELATTQPVRQAGAPLAPGVPQADELGWTLRERLWLTRAALGTIALSIAASLMLITLLPAERALPQDALQATLAARSLAPIGAYVAAPPSALPAAEVRKAPEPIAAPSAAAPEPMPEPLVSEERPLFSRPARRVIITRGHVSPASLPAAPAVDLSKPQALAPRRAVPEPVVDIAPPAAAKPGPELKRPTFE
jgi:hypothetical protein